MSGVIIGDGPVETAVKPIIIGLKIKIDGFRASGQKISRLMKIFTVVKAQVPQINGNCRAEERYKKQLCRFKVLYDCCQINNEISGGNCAYVRFADVRLKMSETAADNPARK